MKEEEIITKTVIELDAAVRIARSLLRDMQYGYSIDDLVVAAYSFMENESFTVVDFEDNVISNPYASAPEMYEFIRWLGSVDGQCAILNKDPEIVRKAQQIAKKSRGKE